MRAHVLERQLLDESKPTDTSSRDPCPCPHLLRWLPHALSLDQIHGKLKNPVHALHLEAHIDDGSTHFGPEQVRLQALQKPGLSEYYFQLTGNSRKEDDASDMFVIRHANANATSNATKGHDEDDDPNHSSPQKSKTSPTKSMTAPSSVVSASDIPSALQQQEHQQYLECRRRESNILAQRQTFLGKRTIKKATPKQSKRKTNPNISIDYIAWEEEASRAKSKVEQWMEWYRNNRTKVLFPPEPEPLIFGEQLTNPPSSTPSCTACIRKTGSSPKGDSLLQCLDCGYVGCLPCSLDEHSRQHVVHHFLSKNHSIGVTCGPRGTLYCFGCADIVRHDIFDMERVRLQISAAIPAMAWPAHPVQRSMDAFQFLSLPEHGVVWKGLMASYPSVVPDQHLKMAQFMMKRHNLMKGKLKCKWGNKALNVGLYQYQNGATTRLTAPTGLYNLGNTCFMNGVLQCLMHCVPLQEYFLNDIGHDAQSCRLARATAEPPQAICLGCELDTLFLKGLGSSMGKDVVGALEEEEDPLRRFEETSTEKGLPLIPSELLTAAWKSGGMDHLAGYEQRDAHEFLQALLDLVGKHTSAHHRRIQANLSLAGPFGETLVKTKEGDGDIVKKLFEGSLRSVSICEECGCKRSMVEAFLNVSLPLSKHTDAPSRYDKGKISVERCLKQFTHPESLVDPVDCPTCKRKTKTRKQHTFGSLPKILCLHLKRFDAAKNRKITDFVSFPARGLDMGPLLPQWAEVLQGKDDTLTAENGTSPQVHYDLFGTLNHTGSLSQGHYIANVMVEDRWFYCNDAGVFDTTENEVVKSDGAYVLFYIRR